MDVIRLLPAFEFFLRPHVEECAWYNNNFINSNNNKI